jgi:Alpha/beta hydrolase domain
MYSSASHNSVAVTAKLAGMLVAVFAIACHAVVPTPTVMGPLPGDVPGSADRNYPFFATDIVLSDYGYTEQEFFFDGAANVYSAPAPSGGVGNNAASAATATIVSTGHPYRSRLLVRRPTDATKFNGVVVVEWLNVTNGYDTDVHWFYQKEFFLRAGYAWVGVSAQNAGLSNTPNGLKVWSPLRYSTLNVNDSGKVTADALGYDIYSQAAQAIRSVPVVMGGLPVRTVLAIGQSQSAGRLGIYLNAVHIIDPIYDGAMLASGGQIIRNDLTIPVIKLLTETEFAMTSTNEIPVLQPDTDKIRIWPVAGSSHSEQYSLLVRAAILLRDLNAQAFDTCATPARSRVPNRYVYNAAVNALVQWSRNDVQPAHAPPVQVISASPPSIARDMFGNGLGGIRLAEMDVPVAHDGGETCALGGTHVPFDAAMLNALYPTPSSYTSRVFQTTNAAIAAGFVLLEDGKATEVRALTSLYGTGLMCGPLCVDVQQFPIHPSTELLKFQTDFMHFVGWDQAVSSLTLASRALATGYTLGSGAQAKASFAQSIGYLQAYIANIENSLNAGHLKPETASLLVSQANTLISLIGQL